MPIVQIAPATRQGMKLLISLYGMSETGKTYSALKLAAGIEPDPAKRGLLDTEGGERGRAYVDAIPGGYMYGALSPPFTPERYLEALRDFVKAGVSTLVVDSVSHIWFAEGGVLEQVETATEKNDLAKWAKPKRRLAKATNAWLQCGLHLILCARGKQPLVKDDVTGKLVPGPVIPIQEKSLRYDITIMGHMLGDGRFSVARDDGGKCPGILRPIFEAGERMDEAMGRKLIEWIGGQDAFTGAHRALLMDAREEASKGSDPFRIWWKETSPEIKEFLRPHLANMQSVAQAADRETERLKAGEVEGDDGANPNPFGTAALASGVTHIAPSDQAAA